MRVSCEHCGKKHNGTGGFRRCRVKALQEADAQAASDKRVYGDGPRPEDKMSKHKRNCNLVQQIGAGCSCGADEQDLVYRLRKRAEIRRAIPTRKSVQEGAKDRLADLLDEAAAEIERLRVIENAHKLHEIHEGNCVTCYVNAHEAD